MWKLKFTELKGAVKDSFAAVTDKCAAVFSAEVQSSEVLSKKPS